MFSFGKVAAFVFGVVCVICVIVTSTYRSSMQLRGTPPASTAPQWEKYAVNPTFKKNQYGNMERICPSCDSRCKGADGIIDNECDNSCLEMGEASVSQFGFPQAFRRRLSPALHPVAPNNYCVQGTSGYHPCCATCMCFNDIYASTRTDI